MARGAATLPGPPSLIRAGPALLDGIHGPPRSGLPRRSPGHGPPLAAGGGGGWGGSGCGLRTRVDETRPLRRGAGAVAVGAAMTAPVRPCLGEPAASR